MFHVKQRRDGKMAKKAIEQKKKPRWRRWLALILICALLIALGWMHLTASVVHVRRAAVRLRDLPQAFSGTTVLYCSDIDLCGIFDAPRMNRIFDQFKALHPDILLLGGDYVSPTLLERLNRKGAELSRAGDFLQSLGDFPAPLGKFAISGENDGGTDALRAALEGTGVEVIDNSLAIVQKDGAAIGIVGVSGDSAALSAIAGNISADQCAIALAHSPDKIVDIRVCEAAGGGVWADLVLAGHTHGGQIRLFGRSVLSLNAQERQRLAGWYPDALPMLVTTGIGCEGANLRLGTQAEVWLITLERADGTVQMEFGG